MHDKSFDDQIETIVSRNYVTIHNFHCQSVAFAISSTGPSPPLQTLIFSVGTCI